MLYKNTQLFIRFNRTRGGGVTRSENGTYQHDVVYLILIFNQNDKNVYF